MSPAVICQRQRTQPNHRGSGSVPPTSCGAARVAKLPVPSSPGVWERGGRSRRHGLAGPPWGATVSAAPKSAPPAWLWVGAVCRRGGAGGRPGYRLAHPWRSSGPRTSAPPPPPPGPSVHPATVPPDRYAGDIDHDGKQATGGALPPAQLHRRSHSRNYSTRRWPPRMAKGKRRNSTPASTPPYSAATFSRKRTPHIGSHRCRTGTSCSSSRRQATTSAVSRVRS